MEPELPTPRLNPEHGPAPDYREGEFLRDQSPEVAPAQSGERYEQRSEASASEASGAPAVALPPVVPTPVADDQSTLGVSQDDDLPSVAADDDLIEKEWVDKAKQILANTKDDPYLREQEISRLQVEYLKKRYGKELGVSS